MKTLPFKKIDAFASGGSAGYPAGYVQLVPGLELTEAEMLQTAKELKGYVNEVGFVRKRSPTKLGLRFYSSEREVDFCGHATVAILYDLFRQDPELALLDGIEVETNRGVLFVENRIATEDAVYIMSPVPFAKELMLDLDDAARQLKISRSDIRSDLPVRVINAGLATLIFPIASLETVLSLHPDQEGRARIVFGGGAVTRVEGKYYLAASSPSGDGRKSIPLEKV